jgi:hypothetical protein
MFQRIDPVNKRRWYIAIVNDITYWALYSRNILVSEKLVSDVIIAQTITASMRHAFINSLADNHQKLIEAKNNF